MIEAFHLGTALAAALMSAVVNGAAWFLFRRVIERQDARMTRQEEELQVLRDERLVRVETALRCETGESKDGRRRMYERLEKGYVPLTVCTAHRAGIERRMEQGDAEFRDLRSDAKFLRSEVARIGTVMDLVAKEMGLKPGVRT